MSQKVIYTFISQKIFLVGAFIFSLIVSVEAFNYLRQKDAVDLGFRVTGARLLSDHKSPYLYSWKEGDDKKYYNQYEVFGSKVNGVTVPPSVLILMRPLASLESNTIKWIWTILSYAFIGISLFLFYKLSDQEYKQIVVAFGLFFFLGSIGWLLHVQRGQNYIVYLLLISLTYYFYKKENILLALGVLSLLVWLRLPFILLFILFISYFKNIKYVLIVFGYIILLTSISFLFSSTQDWNDYSYAVSEWSKAQIEQANLFSDRLSEASKNANIGAIKNERDYLISNSSIQYLFQYHFKVGLYTTDLFAIFMMSVALVLYPIRKQVRRGSKEILFLTAFLIYILFELCIPAPRFNYNFIQWMFPLSLLIISYKEIEVKYYQWSLIVIGLLLNMGLLLYIPRSMVIGEGLIFISVWLILIGNKKKHKVVLQ